MSSFLLAFHYIILDTIMTNCFPYTVKKVNDFAVPNYSRAGRVWFPAGEGKIVNLFYSVYSLLLHPHPLRLSHTLLWNRNRSDQSFLDWLDQEQSFRIRLRIRPFCKKLVQFIKFYTQNWQKSPLIKLTFSLERFKGLAAALFCTFKSCPLLLILFFGVGSV